MYYSHFGLTEPPFKITPNTDFFFTGSNRGAVLDALLYTITHGEGIIKVVGEVGSGKTMLCRMLQTILPTEIESIYLANPSVAPEDVLFAIAFELQLKLPKNADRLTVLQLLQTHLLKRHAEGRQVVIFIEEAQGMPLATLEEIRLLSNLETKQDKLLQIVLFGQPELDDNLNKTHIRQLRERITHSFKLAPMHKQDIQEYLMFRLRAAGYRGPHLFSDAAIRAISSAAKGLVRRVNILADKALLAAYADNVYLVKPKHVKAAVKDSAFGEKMAHIRFEKLALIVLSLLLLAALVIGCWFFAKYGNNQNVALEVAPASEVAKAAPANTLATKSAINKQALDTLSIAKVAGAETIAEPQSVYEKPLSTDAELIDTPLVKTDIGNIDTNMSLESQRVNQTQTWLLNQPENMLTLQIKSIAKIDAVAEELHQLRRIVDINNVYLYARQKNGVRYTVILYGLYHSRSAALAALATLPTSIQSNQPYFRTIGGIKKDLSAENTAIH